jgi:WD40 repeat protein
MEEVVAFGKSFGPGTARFACHAAFPMFLTPELINLIRINFLSDDRDPPSWLAEADFLLSPLCVPLGEKNYCVEPRVRELLLADLLNWYGTNEANRRLYALADFLVAYLDRTGVDGTRPDILRSQRWIAWSVLSPERVVRDMSALLDPGESAASASAGFMRHVLVATMLEVVRDPLEARIASPQFQRLIEASEFVAQYWYRGTVQSGPSAVDRRLPSPNSLLQSVQDELRGRGAELPEVPQAHGVPVAAVAVSPDGRAVVSGSDDGAVRIWDMATGQALRTLEGHRKGVNAVAVSRDGQRVVSASDDGMVRVWDLASGRLLLALEGHSGWVDAVAVTPDSRLVVSGSSDRTVCVWDLATGRALRILKGHRGWVLGVAVSPDGRHAVSCSDDSTVRVWDLATGNALHTLEGHGGWVWAVAFSPDGKRVVSGSEDGTVRVWDPATGAPLRILEGHLDWVNAVAVTPNGRAISGSDDGTVRVWDLDTSTALLTLRGHRAAVRAVAIGPDGRHVISGSDDGTLGVWELDVEPETTDEEKGTSWRSFGWVVEGREQARGRLQHAAAHTTQAELTSGPPLEATPLEVQQLPLAPLWMEQIVDTLIDLPSINNLDSRNRLAGGLNVMVPRSVEPKTDVWNILRASAEGGRKTLSRLLANAQKLATRGSTQFKQLARWRRQLDTILAGPRTVPDPSGKSLSRDDYEQLLRLFADLFARQGRTARARRSIWEKAEIPPDVLDAICWTADASRLARYVMLAVAPGRTLVRSPRRDKPLLATILAHLIGAKLIPRGSEVSLAQLMLRNDLLDRETLRASELGELVDAAANSAVQDVSDATGAERVSRPTVDGARVVYDAGNAQPRPGELDQVKLARAEGDPPTTDDAVNQAYDALGATRDFLHNVLGRNSLDDRGMQMTAVVHYGRNYGNAFSNEGWVFLGDGDGRLFRSFSGALDIIAHSLFHIVLRYEANLLYEHQSGAVMECICDVFGVLVKQYSLNQRAHEADWLFGADVWAPGIQGVAFRSLAAPGTAFDDPALGGRDRQPRHMKDFVSTDLDGGGVHINNGIPNHAFYLIATELGGYAWEIAGHIWYEAFRGGKLGASPTFQSFAQITAATADRLYGTNSPPAQAVRRGWEAVGVTWPQGAQAVAE